MLELGLMIVVVLGIGGLILWDARKEKRKAQERLERQAARGHLWPWAEYQNRFLDREK